MRVSDSSGRNPSGLIEVDPFIEIVLDGYADMAARAKDDMEEVLISADVK